MSRNDIDITDRDQPGPIDVLAAAQTVIDDHTTRWVDNGWGGNWTCEACWARLTEAEARTHTAHQLWQRGLLVSEPSATVNAWTR